MRRILNFPQYGHGRDGRERDFWADDISVAGTAGADDSSCVAGTAGADDSCVAGADDSSCVAGTDDTADVADRNRPRFCTAQEFFVVVYCYLYSPAAKHH